MSRKIYWNLLVLFGFLCRGIIGTLSEKEIGESSDVLVREKRVINRAPGRDVVAPIRSFPFVVHIKLFRINNWSCVGVILTHHTVLTVPSCLAYPLTSYRVYSGSGRMTINNGPDGHNVTGIRTNTGNHPSRPLDGIALITVSPPFVYSVNTQNIGFYEGHIHPGLYATVAGWGCNNIENPGTEHPDRLRAITVPIISTEECNILYINHYTIHDNDICTLDVIGHQYCGASDAGAPLILRSNHQNKLIGVHLWSGGIIGRTPDVFVNLLYPSYRFWILEAIRSLEEHLRV